MIINKVNLLKNLYACITPTDKKRQSVLYQENKEPQIFDIIEEYEVYLVNYSEYDIEKVEMLVGGYASQDDEGLLETSKTNRDLGQLVSKDFILLETLDFGMLDFMNWYNLDLYLENEYCIKISFAFNGWHLTKDKFEEMPLLNKKGYLLDFDLRDSKLIKEEVKNMDMNGKFTKTNQ